MERAQGPSASSGAEVGIVDAEVGIVDAGYRLKDVRIRVVMKVSRDEVRLTVIGVLHLEYGRQETPGCDRVTMYCIGRKTKRE